MPAEELKFVVGEEENPARVDKYLSAVLPDISRSHLQKLIKDGRLRVNGAPVKAHRKVCEGDVLELQLPEPVALDLQPEDIPVEILYEDKDLLVLNKQPGIVVHPAPGHFQGTLVNALLFRTKDLSTINGVLRPGIVHRLDKDTSGCLVVAKNDAAHRGLAEQFENRKVQKTYVAIVAGRMVQESGVLEMRIGRHPVQRKKMSVRPEGQGREARTYYEKIEELGDCTLLELKPTTGRTHQLRVHLAALGFPILGDMQYGKRKLKYSHKEISVPRQMLHAQTLAFCHPVSGQQISVTAPIPQDMEEVMDALKGNS